MMYFNLIGHLDEKIKKIEEQSKVKVDKQITESLLLFLDYVNNIDIGDPMEYVFVNPDTLALKACIRINSIEMESKDDKMYDLIKRSNDFRFFNDAGKLIVEFDFGTLTKNEQG